MSGMGDDDAWPVMFETSTGRPIELRRPAAGLGAKDWQAGVGFAVNGLLITAENGRRFFRWNPQTGESLPPVDAEQWIWRTACSANGQRFMTGSVTWNSTRHQNAARVWDIASGAAIGQPLEHREPVWGVALSADGHLAVTGSEDHDAALWNVDTGELIGSRCRHPARVKAVAISPDGRHVLSGSEDGFARLWTIPGWKPTAVSVEQRSAILSVDFSPDGELFMTASADGLARVWHSTTGFPVGPALVHGDRVNVVRCHPSGTELMTAADDGIVRVWELAVPANADVTRLMRQTELLAGLRLETNGAVRPLTIQEWLANP